jgi:phosphoserine aminotransferase
LHNFGAGPGALPLPVLAAAREALRELPGAGATILEISHRSARFEEIMAETEANLRELLGIDDAWAVLFLQGGARQQFALIPINFLAGSGRCAEYVVSGYWSRTAYDEATLAGNSAALWDGAGDQYRRMPRPDELALPPARAAGAAYVHYTVNETIEGTQLPELPEFGAVPAICDASSEILSRPLPLQRCAMIYAGAQKNLGAAGLTLVAVRREMLERAAPPLPAMFDYRRLAEAGSLLNTPPVFAIYVTLLVTRWLRNEIGGVVEMARRNRAKARILYQVLDQSGGFYRGHALPQSRSCMNVTWRIADPALEPLFLEQASDAGFIGLGGHRSVGGLRASLYNAVTPASCRALAGFMEEFMRCHG